ncbi:spore germination protein [Marininema halotolerans]|uniref:Spore germination protein gerPA/gerPF n=1 Tax=Marininema halotolerans TaxID=1155944 RepID=A0A1I6NWH8_9BACL|nr:spore germination protein [Marininema halotolerans]SFS32291.1 Spore germination protein gerPA/gerPF [Marininema halotolerans]
MSSFLNNIREMKVQAYSSAGALSWGNTVNLSATNMQKSAGGSTLLGDYNCNRQQSTNYVNDNDFMDQTVPFLPYW